MNRVVELQGRLDALRVELPDLAYLLECRGRHDAADLAGKDRAPGSPPRHVLSGA